MYRDIFRKIVNTDRISEWKSKGACLMKVSPDTSDNTLAPALSYFGNNARVNLIYVFYKKIKLHLLIKNQKTYKYMFLSCHLRVSE